MGRKDRSVISLIFDDIRELSFSFISFTLVSVCRSTNNVAHNCAKFACTNGDLTELTSGVSVVSSSQPRG
jgi:hypothetical protein